MIGLLVAAALVQTPALGAPDSDAYAAVCRTQSCGGPATPPLIYGYDPNGHPDIPIKPMCDPMPVHYMVCAWKPGAAESWQCPANYTPTERKLSVVCGGTTD